MEPISIAMALAQFAPGIVKLFTGSDKAAEIAGHVVSIAQTVTGAPTGEAALAAIQADPSKVLDFQLAMANKQADLEEAYLVDRQSARARDVAIVQAGRYNWRGDVLAVLAVGGLVLCVYFIARDAGLPERAVNAIMFVAGVLASAVRDVYGFEFGSSRSSQTKDVTINNLTK